jgi:hypothetical protein
MDNGPTAHGVADARPEKPPSRPLPKVDAELVSGSLNRSECQNFLQVMFKEQCDQARQHETLRQQSTSLVLTIVGAIAALATASGGALIFYKSDPNGSMRFSPWLLALYSLLGLLIIGVSHHGRKLSLKHYERNRMHTVRARVYRALLEDLFPLQYGERARTLSRIHHESRKGEAKKKAANERYGEWAGFNGNFDGEWAKVTDGRIQDVIEQPLFRLWVNLYRFLSLVGMFLLAIPLIVAMALEWEHVKSFGLDVLTLYARLTS